MSLGSRVLAHVRLRVTSGAVVLVCISMLFTAAVYRIDSSNIDKLAKVQATAAANGARIAVSCHQDLVNINLAHAAIRKQAELQIETSHQAIQSIHIVLDSGNVPPVLVPLYQQALIRQHHLIVREQALKASVKDVTFIC